MVGRKINSSLLMYQCWFVVVVFQNILSFMKQLNIYISNVTTSICGKLFRWKGSPIFAKNWILALAKSVETFVMMSISEMPTIKYCYNLGTMMDTTKYKILKNAEVVIRVLCNWQLLEEIYTQDIQKILIMYTKTVMIFCWW